MPQGTGDQTFLTVLDTALSHLTDFDPDVIVVALGLDASQADPLAFLAITTDGFRRVAERIGAFAQPTLLVQEGGYISDQLGDNLAAFLEGFASARR